MKNKELAKFNFETISNIIIYILFGLSFYSRGEWKLALFCLIFIIIFTVILVYTNVIDKKKNKRIKLNE